MKIKIPIPVLVFVLLIVIVSFFSLPAIQPTPAPTPTQPVNNQAPVSAGETVEPTGEVVEVSVVARQFQFEPNPIRVPAGSQVRLRITSVDVPHGFALPDFNINAVLQPGEEVVVEFLADKRGRFGFYCSVPCGIGHSGMIGNLIVE